MKFDLVDTDASRIAASLVKARRAAGSPAMGMVLTLVVVTDEAHASSAMRAAAEVSAEHPARILGVIRRKRAGPIRLDASVRVGQNTSGESVVLRLSGDLVDHADSVVLPLLLPDSPVVLWWPHDAPSPMAADPLGVLAQRRISDSTACRTKRAAMLAQARHYVPGDTDLAWTRLTPWRGLLAAALDQHPVTVQSAEVRAERSNPSADLLVAWLASRLGVTVTRHNSRGPGLTQVRLLTRHGDIAISRPSGRSAVFAIPGEADRPVALERRTTAELMAEELRRLDEDEVYAEAVRSLTKRQDTKQEKSA
ncbi:MAG: glucose-6-phosphate dehydrogenase assembly protein OpcA [Nocardioidaceae bacterium]|nr:glucose-6-phosphate dehydrogenase assembly protein OpcA [Nocardioidaceae bacterium]